MRSMYSPMAMVRTGPSYTMAGGARCWRATRRYSTRSTRYLPPAATSATRSFVTMIDTRWSYLASPFRAQAVACGGVGGVTHDDRAG
jgi:hypothetical protein